MIRRTLTLIALTLAALLISACTSAPTQSALTVTIAVEGGSRTVSTTLDATVGDVLRQAAVTLSDLDRVNPPTYSRVTDGMTITIVRVVEQFEVTQEPLPFERRTTLNDGLATGETRLLQAGVNGTVEITFRTVTEDGKEVSRAEVKRVITVSPQPEVVMIGSQGQLPPVTVNGTLAYIASGNAWIIRGNSHDRRPLTLDGGLDGKVFQLSSDGKRLIYTRTFAQATAPPITPTPSATSTLSLTPAASPGGSGTPRSTKTPTPTPKPTSTPTPGSAPNQPFNALWIIPDTTAPEIKPVRLNIANVLYAEFMPGDSSQIVYSTAEPRPNFPGWQANNDLWRAEVNARGVVMGTDLLLKPSSGGIYGWYGTLFALSPDGNTIAWAQADGIGVLREAPPTTPTPSARVQPLVQQTLISFVPRRAYDFVWVPTLAWSPDGALIATTLHGPPLADEAPEDSPIFNTTVLPVQGGYSVDLVDRAGMWSEPRFSPAAAPDGTVLAVKVAFFQALQPLDSVVSRYQLVMADRDGSNSQVLFPQQKDQPGISPRDAFLTWSPDGRQIALVYQGNLYLLDVASGLTQQITQDGLSSTPRWTP